MELRDLEYFAVIATHQHMGRAADAIGLSQPALSKSLRRLETIVGTKLFNRTSKGLELTAEGSMLLLRVRELRHSLQNIGREISDVSQGRAGTLRIGFSWPVSRALLSAACAKFVEDTTRAKVHVMISDGDLLFPALQSHELDLIVTYYRPTEGLIAEELYEDEFVVCASSNHPLSKRKKLAPSDLTDEKWALSEPTLLSQRWLFDKFREAALPAPHIVFETRALWLKQEVVARSQLLTFTSRSIVQHFAASASVEILPISPLAWRYPVSVVYQKQNIRPLVRRFTEVLKAQAVESNLSVHS